MMEENSVVNKQTVNLERTSTPSRLRRILATVFVGLLVIIGYFLTNNYFQALAAAERASLMRLAGIANTLAMQIDGDLHARVMQKHLTMDAIVNSQQDSDYFTIHQMLLQSYEANMLKTPIYTIVLDSTDHCYFGVTSAEIPYFRHPYRSAPALLMEKHAEGAMIPRYKDEFGNWLSAFAAIRNRSGKMVGLVQVDQPFEAFLIQAETNVLYDLLLSLGISLVFMFVLFRILHPILLKERKTRAKLDAANAENELINQALQVSLEKITSLDSFRKEMIANLSHDLRTPLASILGYIETLLLKKQQMSEPEREKFLQIALTESKRLERLVSDLFDLSKLESGQIHVEFEPFNIAELAQDILHKYQLPAERKKVKLLTDFSDDLPLAYADIRWIDRVLQNLMDNALRYVPEEGFVMFTIFVKENKLNFKVCNNGSPIPEAHLERVFDRYFKSSNRNKESTGLGLTIIKKVLDLHQERVWAESTEELVTFRFTLAVFNSSEQKDRFLNNT